MNLDFADALRRRLEPALPFAAACGRPLFDSVDLRDVRLAMSTRWASNTAAVYFFFAVFFLAVFFAAGFFAADFVLAFVAFFAMLSS